MAHALNRANKPKEIKLEKGWKNMWCVTKKGVCIMVQDTQKRDRAYGYKYVYIREKVWLRMTEQEKQRYII